jgi:hypothetical protein
MQRTFHTLEWWTKDLFEKLGWMILATHEQNLNKVTLYLESINSLLECIEEKIKITKDVDRINDLNIMLLNVEKLKLFASHSLTNRKNFNF